MQSKGLDSINPMKLAWLLRADLRRSLPAGDAIPDWFEMWWNIEGISEYPAWADSVSASSAHLFEPLKDWPSYGAFGVSPALKYIFERRKDLQETFDLSSQTGQWQAIAWFYTHGIQEYRLVNRVSAVILKALDETPPFLKNTPKDDAPELTWLMYFVWLCSTHLQTPFDLRTQNGRREYLQWFLMEGVPTLQLRNLVSRRWKYWLREPLRLVGVPNPLPRAAYLLLQRRSDLQNSFNVSTRKGSIGLASWIRAEQTQDKQVSWWASDPAVTQESKTTRPFGLNLIGFAFGELGIGEDVRMAAAACDAAGIPYSIVNISPGSQLRQADRFLESVVNCNEEVAPYSVNLFCLTGFDTVRVALEKGTELFGGRYNIGWWPWELPVWPSAWTYAFDVVDEVWAATEFTYEMYRKTLADRKQSRTALTLMPMSASISRLKSVSRRGFALPHKRFLFLYIFDFNSYLDRKNPEAAVKAFISAFKPDDRSVGLIIKTMNAKPNNPKWTKFLRFCASDQRIVVLQETMDRGKVLGLIRSCDAYVSLHRSEGFGRSLAEAMLLGKPVVATNYSGNVDFMHPNFTFPVSWRKRSVKNGEYPFVSAADKAWWADPSVEAAADQMRKARSITAAHRRQIATYAERKFAVEASGFRLNKRLLDIARDNT